MNGFKPIWQPAVLGDGEQVTPKLHGFIDGKSMCGKYSQDTDYYFKGIDCAKSGEILSNPQFVCKTCRDKWIKEFNLKV